MNDFKPTKSQKELMVKMEAFLKGSDRIFRLTGKPGVGKTTINKIVLSKYIEADKKNNSGNGINVAGITFAHKAKKVLGQYIPNVFTFASAYGMKEVVDEDTGKRTFQIDKYISKIKVPVGRRNIPVFVHDEVSQYSEEMLKIVLENTSVFSKIIFIGDKAQLPPVDNNKEDKDSPVFNIELPENCQHELTERVRQAEGNPILELSDIIREEIFGNQNIQRVLEALRKPTRKNGMGYDFLSYSELNEHFKNNNLLDIVFLGYRKKKSINYYNPRIRNYLLNNPVDDIVPGDIVCMTDNFYVEEYGGAYCKFHNADVLLIKEVSTKKDKIIVGGKSHYIDVFIADTDKGDGFITPTRNGRVDFETILQNTYYKCKRGELKWNEYWNLKKIYCHWIYGYCLTVYKSQGSTYDRVYLDINDILLTGPLSPKRKLQAIYTAITRASKDVFVLRQNV